MVKIYKSKMTQKNMEKGMNLILLAVFILIISFSFASASCTVKGYVFNLTDSIVNSTNYPAGALVNGKCFGPNVQCINAPTSSIGLYSCAFGTVTNCASCSSIYLNATNSTANMWGMANIASPAALTLLWQNITMNNTFPVADNTFPTYSNYFEPSDPSAYGGPFKFNISWSDNVAIDNVILTFDNKNYSYKPGGDGISKSSVESIVNVPNLGYAGITGSSVVTPLNEGSLYSLIYTFIKNLFSGKITGMAIIEEDYLILDSGVYSKTFSSLGVGVHNYTWWANDTSGNANSTDALKLNFTVTQATPTFTFNVNSPTYPNPVISSCSCSNPEASTILYRDGHQVTPGSEVLGVSAYNYICNITSTQNYTNASSSLGINVNQGSPSSYMHLFLNGAEANSSNNVGQTSNITAYSTAIGDSDLIYNLYNNSVLVGSGDPAISMAVLPIGSYIYVYNTTGGTNWTSGSTPPRNLTITADTTPPVISGMSPTGALAAGTISTPVNITTDKTAICRYNTTSSTFNFATEGINFTYTNALAHSFKWNVSDGNTYTFYYKCNDTNGNVNPTSTTHSFSVASPTQQQTTTSGGGGGGGGGAFLAPAAAEGEKEYRTFASAEKTLSNMVAGTPTVIALAEEKIPILEVSFDVLSTISLTKFSISLISQPSSIPKASDKVYSYLSIDAPGLSGNLKQARIKFYVDNSWLNSNNVKKNEIALFRYTTKWDRLNTKYLSQDSNKTYYESITPGFSYFAIAYSPCTENWTCSEWANCKDGSQTRVCTDSNDCGSVEQKPVEAQVCEKPFFEQVNLQLLIIGVIAFVAAIVILVFISMKKPRRAKKKIKFKAKKRKHRR
jgi:PGF-pre-PGF domain-containing protein